MTVVRQLCDGLRSTVQPTGLNFFWRPDFQAAQAVLPPQKSQKKIKVRDNGEFLGVGVLFIAGELLRLRRKDCFEAIRQAMD